MPERPSRFVSSARTSSMVTPHSAQSTSRWKTRSALSETTASRLSETAAMASSTASSPIFCAILARPLAKSLAVCETFGSPPRRLRIVSYRRSSVSRFSPMSLSLLSEPDRNAGGMHMLLRFRDAMPAEMENRGREHGRGMALLHAVDEMVEIADAARGDHRNAHRIGHRAGQFQVEALLGAIAVHRGEQDLAGAVGRRALRPVDGIEARTLAAAMGEDFPFSGRCLPRIDGDDDALAAEFLRRLADEFRPRHGSGVDARLVSAGQQQLADVFHRAHAAADGERHEAALRRARHHVEQGVARIR